MIDLDRLTAEKVLDLDRADLAGEVEVGRDHHRESGQRLDRNALGARDLDDTLALLSRGGRDRDQELVRAAVAQQVAQLGGRSEHANPVQAQVLLARVVVDEPDGRVAERGAAEHLAQDLLGRVAGADDDDLLPARDDGSDRRPLDERAREQPRAHHESEQQQTSTTQIPRGTFSVWMSRPSSEKTTKTATAAAATPRTAPHMSRVDTYRHQRL